MLILLRPRADESVPSPARLAERGAKALDRAEDVANGTGASDAAGSRMADDTGHQARPAGRRRNGQIKAERVVAAQFSLRPPEYRGDGGAERQGCPGGGAVVERHFQNQVAAGASAGNADGDGKEKGRYVDFGLHPHGAESRRPLDVAADQGFAVGGGAAQYDNIAAAHRRGAASGWRGEGVAQPKARL